MHDRYDYIAALPSVSKGSDKKEQPAMMKRAPLKNTGAPRLIFIVSAIIGPNSPNERFQNRHSATAMALNGKGNTSGVYAYKARYSKVVSIEMHLL